MGLTLTGMITVVIMMGLRTHPNRIGDILWHKIKGF